MRRPGAQTAAPIASRCRPAWRRPGRGAPRPAGHRAQSRRPGRWSPGAVPAHPAARGRVPVFNAAFGQRLAGGGGLHQFQAVRGHQRDAAGAPRRVAGSARALHQPRHALWPSRSAAPAPPAKVHAQVQARCAHHGFQGASLQASTQPRTSPLSEPWCRAWCPPSRARLQQRLVPALGLRAGVGEKCCTTLACRLPLPSPHSGVESLPILAVLAADCALRRGPVAACHLRHPKGAAPASTRWPRWIAPPAAAAQAHVPGPGKTLHAFGQQHLHLQCFVDAALHQQRFGAARCTRRQGRAPGWPALRAGCPAWPTCPTPAGAGSSPTGAPAPVAPARRACCPPARAIRPPPPVARWPGVARIGAGQQQRHAFRAWSPAPWAGAGLARRARRWRCRRCAGRWSSGARSGRVLAERAASLPPARAWA